MYPRTVLPLLICSLAIPVSALSPDGQDPWKCFTATGAHSRKQQLENGMLPGVVFTGETRPAAVTTRMAAHQVPALSVAVICAGALDSSSCVAVGVAEWEFEYNARVDATRRRYTAVWVRGGPLGWQMVSLQISPALRQ